MRPGSLRYGRASGRPGSCRPQGFCLGSVCFLNRDPDAFRLYLAHRDAYLEDSPLIAGGDVLGVHPDRQPDQPGERAVTELRAIRPAVLPAALRADCQGPALDGDFDVPLGVQAGSSARITKRSSRAISSTRKLRAAVNCGGPAHGDSSQSARPGSRARVNREARGGH